MRADLICFFQKLVDDLKGGKLSVEEEQKLSEYFMSHKFLENRANLEEKEIIKYTALGWFIYNYNKKFSF